MRRSQTLLVGVGAAAVALSLTAGPASADPPSGVTPADNSIVAVGSETTQTVSDAFQADYDQTATIPFYSYDATPAGTIVPKAGCASITRPSGTNAGLAALGAGARPANDSTDYCIDIARSVRGPVATDPKGLAFVPFGQDAITWTAASGGNAPVSLTITQLKAIYSCDASILSSSESGPVTWNEVGGTSSNAVVPVQPPSSAGIRTSFLSAIGVTTVGSCVVPTDGSVVQNEGTNPIFTGPNKNDIVFPYSTGVYLSQTVHGHGTSTDNPGPLTLRQIAGTSPTSGKGAKQIVNKKFPIIITLYNVVRSTGKKAKYVPTYLQPLLGASNNKGYICSKATSSIITSYGFLTLGGKCGKVTITN